MYPFPEKIDNSLIKYVGILIGGLLALGYFIYYLSTIMK